MDAAAFAEAWRPRALLDLPMFHCSGSSLAFSVETGGDEMSEAEMRKRACLVNARQRGCPGVGVQHTHTHIYIYIYI